MGTVAESGARLVELHFDNALAASLHTGGKPGLRFRLEVLRALPALARDVENEAGVPRHPCGLRGRLFRAEGTFVGLDHRPLSPFTRWRLARWEQFPLAR